MAIGRRSVRSVSRQAIQVGFVPLIDAAPLIVAKEMGYFADEGLDVQLERQVGWGNVRDKLSYGQLSASHAPIGMPPASVAGVELFPEPLVSLMSLGTGGNAITVTTRLGEMADGPASPTTWRRFLGRPLRMAHVSASSTHHYLLRDYLATGGLDPDRDTNLCVMPPPQLVGHLEIDSLDGFCVGEPWNTLAMLERRGTIVAATTELKADHPEKVLAVTRPWFEKNRPVAESLVRATVRACDFCDDVANRGRLTEILAHRSYLSLDEAVISKSLSIDEWYRRVPRRPRFRSFARSATVPRLQDAEWIVRKMIRWGQLPRDVDAGRIAAASMVAEPYAEAVATLKTTAPEPAALVAGASE